MNKDKYWWLFSFLSEPQLIVLCNTGEYPTYLEHAIVGDDVLFWQNREKGFWWWGRGWVGLLCGHLTLEYPEWKKIHSGSASGLFNGIDINESFVNMYMVI